MATLTMAQHQQTFSNLRKHLKERYPALTDQELDDEALRIADFYEATLDDEGDC